MSLHCCNHVNNIFKIRYPGVAGNETIFSLSNEGDLSLHGSAKIRYAISEQSKCVLLCMLTNVDCDIRPSTYIYYTAVVIN